MVSHTGKLDGLLAKLATLIHISRLEYRTHLRTDLQVVDVVPVECLRDAWTLVEVYREHARAMYGTATKHGELVRKAAQFLKRWGRTKFTRKEFFNYSGMSDLFTNFEHMDTVLGGLEVRGIIYWEPRKGSGGWWHVNPKFLE